MFCPGLLALPELGERRPGTERRNVHAGVDHRRRALRERACAHDLVEFHGGEPGQDLAAERVRVGASVGVVALPLFELGPACGDRGAAPTPVGRTAPRRIAQRNEIPSRVSDSRRAYEGYADHTDRTRTARERRGLTRPKDLDADGQERPTLVSQFLGSA